MFDTTPRDRIIKAAMDLAQNKNWKKITLLEIAQKADVPLAEFRSLFKTKEAIFSAFTRKIDDEVLRKMSTEAGSEENSRERLFDVLMTRFEIMTPFRLAIKNIAKRWQPGSGARSFCRVVSSNYWMLNAAGISAEGPSGAARLIGAAKIYGSVFAIWLEDEEEGLPKTMKALDGQLRKGEKWLGRANGLCCAARDLMCRFAPSRNSKDMGPDGSSGANEPDVVVAAGASPQNSPV